MKDKRSMEHILGLVLDQIHDWVTITDLDGTIIYVNDAQCRALNRNRGDLVGTHVFSYGEDAAKGALQKMIMERTVADGQWRGEVVHRSPEGEAIVLECKTIQVRDKNGCVVAYAGIATDISERKKAEESLLKNQEKYKKLFDTIPDAILLSEGATGKIFEANKACTVLFGYSHDELLKMSILELSDEPEETKMALKSRKEYVPIRYKRRKNRTVFPAEIVAGYLEWEGQELRFGVVRDISARVRMREERERLERQLQQAQRMEAVGTLAGGIAHDFNNILGVILGCSELLLMRAPEEEREQLEQIYRAGERARDLVKQILVFSRQGEQWRGIIRVDLVVKEALKFLRSSLPADIEIKRGLSKEVTVLGNLTQVHQIIMNLCVNAGHAMQGKGGVLTVDVNDIEIGQQEAVKHGVPFQGRYCRLQVTDTGCGINPNIMERIFEPYFTTKKPGEGTGLGLSVVHGIVKSHGGGITVQSTLGKGTTFQVFLPIADPGEVFEWETKREIQTAKGERLLLVDDDEMVAVTMKRMLCELGYKVTVKTDVNETLEVFQSCPNGFDLVITDMTMPHMSGFDLAKRFIDIRPDIPVILCTGYSEDATLGKMKEAGIRKLLRKPIVLHDLAASIREIMDGKQVPF